VAIRIHDHTPINTVQTKQQCCCACKECTSIHIRLVQTAPECAWSPSQPINNAQLSARTDRHILELATPAAAGAAAACACPAAAAAFSQGGQHAVKIRKAYLLQISGNIHQQGKVLHELCMRIEGAAACAHTRHHCGCDCRLSSHTAAPSLDQPVVSNRSHTH
jgi:hypothetical protein